MIGTTAFTDLVKGTIRTTGSMTSLPRQTNVR